ncbi:hypothetical protein [Marinigracilibium pacificum]|uniref:Uncharacterized protein n=1 Tax=Marinigracilibium pacificum TaxID=2729599 RepID=A0A848J6W0_9BACT|nr:hypothetical protein [Marinigracilibium pacificum]NMM50184.1 hypothetical protein [Marinigracilibium pacificum]
MFKRLLLILLALIIVSGVLYFFFYEKEAVHKWDVIPGNTMAIVEEPDISDYRDSIYSRNDFYAFFFGDNPILDLKDSLVASLNFQPDADLFNKGVSYSVHLTGKNEVSTMFLFDKKVSGINKVLNKVHGSLLERYSLGKEPYDVEGVEIKTFSSKGKPKIYYVELGQFGLFSVNNLLIEDAIRSYSGISPSFYQKFSEAEKIRGAVNDEGNLIINGDQFQQFLEQTVDLKFKDEFLGYKSFFKAAVLDVQTKGNTIDLNGFALKSTDPDSYLNIYGKQEGKKFRSPQYIPIQAIEATFFSISDHVVWQNELRNYLREIQGDELRKQSVINNKYNVDVTQWYKSVGSELTLVKLPTGDYQNTTTALIQELSDIGEGLNILNKMAEASIESDSVYVEEYAGIEIREITIKEVPEAVFGPYFRGFSSLYYSVLDNYLIITESVPVLKNMIRSVQEESTWGKNLKVASRIGKYIEDATVAKLINLNRAWEFYPQVASEKYKKLLGETPSPLRSFEWMSMHFSELDNKWYIAANIEKARQIQLAKRETYEGLMRTEFKNPIRTKPFVVRNHNTFENEVLLQDTSNILYLVNGDGQILWQDSLGEKLKGEISQVDFYQNNKLQYFLYTDSRIHIIDRLGNEVDDFPLFAEPTTNIKAANIIDYDNSKRYRITYSDYSGNVYLYNNEKQLLKGWDPKSFNHRLIDPMKHLRVRKKDVMVNLTENGLVQITNRRGEYYDNFPLQLSDQINNSLFIRQGASFRETLMATISAGGKLYEFNLEGKITREKQLVKIGPNTKFELIPDALDKTYLIAAIDGTRVRIMSKDLEILFEKDFLQTDKLNFQYYQFSATEQIIIITDAVQEMSYLYSRKGDLINGRPFQSSHDIALLYFENDKKYKAYCVFGDALQVYEFDALPPI